MKTIKDKTIADNAFFYNWKGSAPKLKSIDRKPFIWRGEL
jgi:hypothetical protein